MNDEAACPACGAGVPEDARFCEACGHDLAQPRPIDREAHGLLGPPDAGVSMEPPLVCASCGATAFGPGNGHRDNCGSRRPAAADHSEIDFHSVAGVSDIGHRHQHNEDAMGVLVFPAGPYAGIVCDGVSSSNRPDTASTAAVAQAVRAFADGLTGVAGGAVTGDEAVTDAAEAAMRAGGRAAQAAAALAAGSNPGPNPPSSTFVAAILTPHAVTIGWTGDSRAYWLPDSPDPDEPEPDLVGDEGLIGVTDTAASVTTIAGPITGAVPARLTIDDTLAGQLGAAGVKLAPDAPNAAALIRWLGADSSDAEPHVFTFTPDRPGRVIVCSDGLYRYAPTAAELAGITPTGTPHEVATALVAYALESGGGDNVSVIVLPYPPA